MATGVLPLCFGAATKFSQLQLDADKTYEAKLRLGVTTTTGDAEGQVREQRPVQVSGPELAAVLSRFTGAIQQIPPMYSALKKDGRALYEYARQGVSIERSPRDVVVHKLELVDGLGDGAPDEITIRAAVSKGTYIRTLAEDIGEALGCGAHLTALRRIASGGFSIGQCTSLDELEAMDAQQRACTLLPPSVLLRDHHAVMLDADNAGRFLSGLRRRGSWPDDPQVAVFAQDPEPALLGTAHVAGGELIPDRLLSPIEIEQILQSQPGRSPVNESAIHD